MNTITFTPGITQSPHLYTRSSGGRSSRLFGLLISRRALCVFESRPRRNFSLGYGCCDCPQVVDGTTRRIS
ncbi:unnamed protein product [Acanthoscelides obtectus]|uniref:Uncharacterized protein n=1 Tax=Acanthoscelides obtectus TaxID=200917 RepID=A0A9P0L849_ACAOB|nr:unnamed protein product [Acanthoscelides obtectus]CAK1646654.1 hypothetical protein AOBTE_LOCUS14789 [Acanthoscelides obtectus]